MTAEGRRVSACVGECQCADSGRVQLTASHVPAPNRPQKPAQNSLKKKAGTFSPN